MSESKKAGNFFNDMRCVPVNPGRRVLPSMPASFPAGTVNHASVVSGIPFRFWLFGTRSSARIYSSTPGNSLRVPAFDVPILEANGWMRYATIPGPVPLPAADLGKQLNPPFFFESIGSIGGESQRAMVADPTIRFLAFETRSSKAWRHGRPPKRKV